MLRWVYVRPELVSLAKRHLKLDWVRMVPLPSKHRQSMMEDVAAALHALVQPACPMLVLVDGDGEGLSTAVAFSIDERNVEFIGVLGKMMGAGHAYAFTQYLALLCCLLPKVCIPAAPAPTTRTRFFLVSSFAMVVGRSGSFELRIRTQGGFSFEDGRCKSIDLA